MTEKIVNGDYVINEETKRPVMIEYIDELLQKIAMHLTARRGSFYPDKNFGSLLRAKQLEQPKNEYALAYARQTLDEFDGVFVKSAFVKDDAVDFVLIINDDERQVSIKLENNI